MSNKIDRECIYNVLKKKNYAIFESDFQPYNLNIIGIRNPKRVPDSFDDWIAVMWKYAGSWEFLKFKATTDPGLYYLTNPMQTYGTAILKEGQYRKAYQLGLHQNRYKALIQAQPLTIIRDFNKDNYLDFTTGRETTGLYGINIHRAMLNGETIQVNKWSAGCQVFANSYQFDVFISLCEQSAGIYGNGFTYSLIDIGDL